MTFDLRLRAMPPASRVAAVFVAAMAILAALAPWLPISSPTAQNLAAEFAPPSWQHWLGRGENGVDVLSQLLWSGRLSLFVAFAVVSCSAFIGVALGTWAGYRRGIFEQLLMRTVDLFYSFPGLLLVVAMAAFLGPSVRNLVVAMIVTSWAAYARLARALTLKLREEAFVSAAQSTGASSARIVVRHLLPNLAAPLLVQMSYGLGVAVLTESSLSFLGLGAPVGTPSWGQMLNQGREVMTTATHLVMVPGLTLVCTVVAFNLLGDGLREAWDPKRRVRNL